MKEKLESYRVDNERLERVQVEQQELNKTLMWNLIELMNIKMDRPIVMEKKVHKRKNIAK